MDVVSVSLSVPFIAIDLFVSSEANAKRGKDHVADADQQHSRLLFHLPFALAHASQHKNVESCLVVQQKPVFGCLGLPALKTSSFIQ